MYIISDIPKRLERWFLKCLYPQLIAEMLQMHSEKKFREQERELEEQQLEKDIERAEKEQAELAKQKKISNVEDRETKGIAGSGMYGAVDVSFEHIQKVLGSANTSTSSNSPVPPPNYSNSTFTPQTQTQFGQLSGATAPVAPQTPNIGILDSTTQTLV